jgi:hypothetical protein
MSEIATSRNRAGRRYKWCPSCDELWLAARMAAAGVDRCPACDGPVLPYVGRSPYDVGRSCADDRSLLSTVDREA